MVDLNLTATLTDGGGSLTFTDPANANDANLATEATVAAYAAVAGTYRGWLRSDLGAIHWVDSMHVTGNQDCNGTPHWYFQYSLDGSTGWTTVATTDTLGNPSIGVFTMDAVLATPVIAQYWRLVHEDVIPSGIVFKCGTTIATWAINEGAEPDPDPEPDPYVPPEPGRAIVEIYVDDPDGYRWDVAEWDEATWADADWVDISEWVIYCDVTWGASRPDAGILADQTAGLWVIETYDPDRVLDPGNEESQFYPHLVPELPIRINHNTRTVRTGQVSIVTYSHADEGGRISASDAVSRASRADVPPGTALGDTFYDRVTDAIAGAGIALWVDFPSSALMDRPLASADVDERASVWTRIADAARELLAVAWVDRDGNLRVTEWDADTDRGLVIDSGQLTDLTSWVSHDGLYSVVRALDDDLLTIAEAAAVPLPAYGERVYERTDPTIDAADWVTRVLADRQGAVLRYRPGTIRPETAAQNDGLVDMELMDVVTLTYPEADPPVSISARVLGARLRVTDRTKRYPAVLTRWEWTLLTTSVPAVPLIADGGGALAYLISDDDGSSYLYPG